MKVKMNKARMIAFCLALMMVVSLMPVGVVQASAAECAHEIIEKGGADSYMCMVCGLEMTLDEVLNLPEHRHVETRSSRKAPTCTETGLTVGSYCSLCGEVLREARVIPALGHSWDEGYVSKEPTDHASGIRTYTCTVCRETKNESIDPVVHVHEKVSRPKIDPTCTTSGYTEYVYCSDCGEVFVPREALPSLGHDWDEGVITKEPTDFESGTRVKTCARCNATKEETIDPLGHTCVYGEWEIVKEVTCEEDGVRTRVCSCGDRQTEDVVSIGHQWRDFGGKAATCTQNGVKPGTYCTACGKVLREANVEIPATGHVFIDGVCETCGTKQDLTCRHESRWEPFGDGWWICTNCYLSFEPGMDIPEVTEPDPTEPTPSEPAEPSESSITRIAGNDRAETARKVADAMKEVLSVDSFDSIIYASGKDFADALSGSYLSAKASAPILLHSNSGLENNVAYIRNNLSAGGVVYILGGSSAVPAIVDETLMDAGITVTRLEGESRYHTNLEILKAAGFSGGKILVCTSQEYADSLSASATGLPILLVSKNWTQLNAEYQTYLNNYRGSCEFVIIGGNAAVSAELEYNLGAYGSVERIYGIDRYETSIMVANRFFGETASVVLAYAKDFPDGLCGGPLAYAMGAPMILTTDKHCNVAAAYVSGESIHKGIVLGGKTLISDAAVNEIFN